jgi:hypothetical protein
LKPIALLKQELREKFRQSDAKFQPLLQQITADLSLSEQDRLVYGFAQQVSSISEKILIVAKEMGTVDSADPLSSRKQEFLKQELETLTRTHALLISQWKAVEPNFARNQQ